MDGAHDGATHTAWTRPRTGRLTADGAGCTPVPVETVLAHTVAAQKVCMNESKPYATHVCIFCITARLHHAPTRTSVTRGPRVGLRFGTRLAGLRVRAGTARPPLALRCLRSGPCRCTCLPCSARAASSSASFWRWALMASPWCRMAARWLSMSLSATSSTNSCMSSVPEPSTSFERKRRT